MTPSFAVPNSARMDEGGLFELDGTPIEPARPWRLRLPAIAWAFAALAVGDLVLHVWPLLWPAFLPDPTPWAAALAGGVRGAATVLLPAVVFTVRADAWRWNRALVAAALVLAARELVPITTSVLGLLGIWWVQSESDALIGSAALISGTVLAAAIAPWLVLRGLADPATTRRVGRTGLVPLLAWMALVAGLEVLQILLAPDRSARVTSPWLVWSVISDLALLGWAWLGLVALAAFRSGTVLWSLVLLAVASSLGSGLAGIVLGLLTAAFGGARVNGGLWLLPPLLEAAAAVALLSVLALAARQQAEPAPGSPLR